MSDFQSVTLARAGIHLVDCDHRTPKSQTTGRPYVGIPQMKCGHIDFSDARLISQDDFRNWTRKAKPQRFDVVLSRRTNPGVVAVDRTNTPFALGQNLVLLRSDGTKVHPPFLRWLCQSPSWWEQIEKFLNVGAVFSSLRCADVPKFELPIPNRATQEFIAATLDALDDKIELNRRTAATLEKMARALWRSWFVDFDPVRARALGQAPAFMDEATAALFPDRFGADGQPEGWQQVGLDEVANFLNGVALRKYSLIEGGAGLPVIKIAELRSGISANTGRANMSVPEKYRVRDGDVLFSWSGSLLQKTWTDGEGWLNQHLFKVNSQLVPKWFHYFAVDFHMEHFRQVAASKATTMGHIQRHHLTDAKVSLPTPDLLQAIDGIVAPIFNRMFACELESRTLAALRDALLPKLMSGELRVPEAERLVEEVA